MAPTIIGLHSESPCPQCGAQAFGSVPDPDYFIPPDGLPMICSNGHVFGLERGSQPAGGGDRILVNKLLKPRRWDIIVFRFPGNPSQNYTKRLVGLPGEMLFIRDGAVWINGVRLEPPPEYAHLEYLTTIPAPGMVLPSWADESNPAKLGPDEFFVLGDFSINSADSRIWERGAPGHPHYAVPESHIIGVVTHIYWPISRWRTFR
jgi:signal peptidase I